MNLLPQCFLYTQDKTLVTRVSGNLKSTSRVCHISDSHELEIQLLKHDPVLLFFDLRAEETKVILPRIFKDMPDSLVLAFGLGRSNPAIEAEAMGAYAVVEFDVERRRLQSLVKHAQEHIKLVKENRHLRSDQQNIKTNPAPVQPVQAPSAPIALHHLSKAFQHFDDANLMLENMAEGIATCAKVSRVGIFAYSYESETYNFRAGVKCMHDARQIHVERKDPLIQWLQLHAHLVCRTELNLIENRTERSILQHSLDTMGAEVIIPLHGRNNIIGWMFIGHHITGIPFSQTDLEELMMLGEHVAISLENQQLYEKVAIQKSLAENVFDSMPVGIVAVDDNCQLRWINDAAREILEVETDSIAKQPASILSSRLANMLTQRINGSSHEEPFEWKEPQTKRTLSVLTRILNSDSKCIGALAIVRDMTQIHLLRKKEEEVERATFWTELAAAMSHEVRNPLVAISTFAQLLPDRYADPDFRNEFSKLVSSEIERLNSMVDQISDFAEKPQLQFEKASVSEILNEALSNSINITNKDEKKIELSVDDALPKFSCDKISLVTCFQHLICNAIEAVENNRIQSIHITAGMVAASENKNNLQVNIMDNGNGIPADNIKSIFSPFYTTKARGIGLGLPIARRTVIDHGGHINVASSKKGTSIEIALPVASNTTKESNISKTDDLAIAEKSTPEQSVPTVDYSWD